MASEGVNSTVNCVERVPPPPPNNLRATFDFETLFPRISWQFPLNKQRDIKRFQIFKRHSLQEPFTLIAEYDFDNSLVPSDVLEVALEKNVFNRSINRRSHRSKDCKKKKRVSFGRSLLRHWLFHRIRSSLTNYHFNNPPEFSVNKCSLNFSIIYANLGSP